MKQKNIWLIVLLFACKSPTNQTGNSTVAEAKEASDSAAIYSQLMVTDANELNSQCPMMVDKETRLDNAQPMVKDNTIRYNYTLVNREKKFFTDLPKVKERMTPSLINIVKTNPSLEIYRQHQTTLEYYYKDKNGEFLFSVPVTPDLYNSK